MSGKYEKEKELERKIKNKLECAPDVVSEYYYSLIGAGKSYETTYRYINIILAFMQYTFDGKYDNEFYKKVKPVHINKYIASMRTKNVNGNTQRTSDSIKVVNWSALNSFFSFLVPNYIEVNPVEKTTRPRVEDNPQITYLEPEEIAKVFHNVEIKSPEKYKNRDLSILKLGFSTGLRVSAIVQIDVNDVDFAKNQIRITEKGEYDRYVMFGENLKIQLQLWLQDREKYFSTFGTNALFVSQQGNRISTRMVDVMFKKYAEGATDKHVHPHVMRHSCATNLYEATGDIYLCSKQLNHKDLSTMKRYAEISQKQQEKAINILDDLICDNEKRTSKASCIEIKEQFIRDYSASRFVPRVKLARLFNKMESFETNAKKDCSQFNKIEILEAFMELEIEGVNELLEYVDILKSYCNYVKFYHKKQVTNVYEQITIDDLNKCINERAGYSI